MLTLFNRTVRWIAVFELTVPYFNKLSNRSWYLLVLPVTMWGVFLEYRTPVLPAHWTMGGVFLELKHTSYYLHTELREELSWNVEHTPILSVHWTMWRVLLEYRILFQYCDRSCLVNCSICNVSWYIACKIS